MKIKELIRTVSSLVAERETIGHGTIRCLFSQQDVDSICAAEGCDEVSTGTVGDDDLAARLAELADDGDRIGDIDFGDLQKLEDVYRGENITDYIDADKENELGRLDNLIEAARQIA